jgi:hypothetical protein
VVFPLPIKINCPFQLPFKIDIFNGQTILATATHETTYHNPHRPIDFANRMQRKKTCPSA